MTLFYEDVKEEYEVRTLLDFVHQLKEFKEVLQKKYPDVDIDSGDIYNHISSDEDEISEMLEADHRLWRIDFIEDRNDGYWTIKQLNNIASITIPIAECDVEEMRDEDWAVDWCFDFVDVHLTRQEEEDDFDEQDN